MRTQGTARSEVPVAKAKAVTGSRHADGRLDATRLQCSAAALALFEITFELQQFFSSPTAAAACASCKR